MVGAVGVPHALDLVRSPACFAACQNCLCFYAMKWSLSSLGCFQMNYYSVMDKKKDALADFVVTKSL